MIAVDMQTSAIDKAAIVIFFAENIFINNLSIPHRNFSVFSFFQIIAHDWIDKNSQNR